MKALKKFLLGFAAFAAMAILGAVCTGAVTYTYEDYTYTLTASGYVQITGYTGNAADVEIPSTIDGKTVRQIGNGAFKGCTTVKSVTIPDSVDSISDSAFNECTSLEAINVSQNNGYYVSENGVLFAYESKETLECYPAGKTDSTYTIPDGVLYIGSYAFGNCRYLKSITIPDSVSYFGNGTFSGCSSLESITIPDEMTTIYSGTFLDCSSLASITIPDGVTSIRTRAFEGCSSLSSITIPDNVKTIENRAFSRCSSLGSINISENNGYFSSDNGVLFNKDKTQLICYPGIDSVNTYTIPDGVTRLTNYAFYGASSLRNVIIPEGVTNLGWYTFYDCTSLASVIIPNGVSEIGNDAFYGCTSLSSVSIPGSVAYISAKAFFGCTSLTSVTIPKTVTSIADYMSNYALGYKYNEESGEAEKIAGFKIYCCSGTEGERYAVDNGFDYLLIDVPASAVTNLKATSLTDTSFTLTWTPNLSADGYIIEKADGSSWVRLITLKNSSVSSYKITGLNASTAYRVKVTPYIMYDGKIMRGNIAVTSAKTTPTAITGLKTIATTNGTSVRLSWDKNTTATGYILEKAVNGNWVRLTIITKNSTTVHTVPGLDPSTEYTLRVTPYTTLSGTIIRGAASTVIGKTSPSAVTGLKASKSTSDSITLKWDINSEATGYIIEKLVGSSWVRVITVTKKSTLSYTVSGLNVTTAYRFKVTPYTTFNGSIIRGIGSTVASKTSPSDISGLTVSKTTADKITLSWDKNPTTSGYIIEKAVGDTWERIITVKVSSMTSYTVSGFLPSTTCRFKVTPYTTFCDSIIRGTGAVITGTTSAE